jgi:hypothetical protein
MNVLRLKLYGVKSGWMIGLSAIIWMEWLLIIWMCLYKLAVLLIGWVDERSIRWNNQVE